MIRVNGSEVDEDSVRIEPFLDFHRFDFPGCQPFFLDHLELKVLEVALQEDNPGEFGVTDIPCPVGITVSEATSSTWRMAIGADIVEFDCQVADRLLSRIAAIMEE